MGAYVFTKPPAFIDKIPLMVEAEPKFTPPAMFTLLNPMVPETEPVPEKVTVPAPVLEASDPEVAVIEPLLATVIVLEVPTLSAPFVKLSVPLNDALEVSVTPALLLIVKFAAPANPAPVACAELPLNV